MPLTPDSSYSTLTQIKNKVRRITRSLDETLLTEDQLNEYINTFVLYDFPEHLRLFNLHENFSFYTEAFVDTYDTNTTDSTNPLYNFQNTYLTINQPLYVAGYKVAYYQDQTAFFNLYPKIKNIQSIGTNGNGIQRTFTGYINTQQGNVQPFVQNSGQGTIINRGSVQFNSVDSSNSTLVLIDYPIDVNTGAIIVPNSAENNSTLIGTTDVSGNASGTVPAASGSIGQEFQIGSQIFTVTATSGALTTSGSGSGTFDTTTGAYTFTGCEDLENIYLFDVGLSYGSINYLTGYYSITFPYAPGSSKQINSQVQLVACSRPFAVMFYDGIFTIRPVPDQAYKVEMEVYKRPTEMLAAGDMPKLAEWWQYIALGTCIKIFQDRMDMDSVSLIMPEFKEQEALIQRRTIVQNTTQRSATIYSQDTNPSGSYGNNGWFGGSGFF